MEKHQLLHLFFMLLPPICFKKNGQATNIWQPARKGKEGRKEEVVNWGNFFKIP